MADICIWNRCNNNCVMCTNPIDFRDKNDSFLYSKKAVLARLESWQRKYLADKESINLTGGEPTIHPDFLSLLKEIRKLFPDNKIAIASNGRMFSYPLFAKKCLSFNNLSFEVALHGSTPGFHDAITGVKGSFKQTVGGISHILAYRNSTHELELRIVITKLNYKNIGGTIEFIKKQFSQVSRVVLVFMEMEGLAAKNFKTVGLTYKTLKPQLSFSRFKKWAEGLAEIRLYHFPLCQLPPQLWPYAWRTLRGSEVTFLPRCKQCLYKKYCLGIHRDYLKLVGNKEFQPIKSKITIQSRNFFHHPIAKVAN